MYSKRLEKAGEKASQSKAHHNKSQDDSTKKVHQKNGEDDEET